MRRFGSPALALGALALLLLLGTWGAHRYRFRFVRQPADLLLYVPQAGRSTAFINFSVLRDSGYLGLLSGKHQDEDYARFVHETGFDYANDLDAAAATWNPSGWTVVAKGRFNWARLRRYLEQHPTHLRLSEIQPDALVLESLPGANVNRERRRTPIHMPTADPVWMKFSAASVQDVTTLPSTARIFGLAVQDSDDVLLSLGASTSGAAFDLKLRATFSNPAAADTASRQLQIDTKLLVLELKREGAQPKRTDLTGLFTAGAFSTVGNELVATWPVYRELLNALR